MTTTRRAVLKAAAWSVPVIAVAAAVPLAAASTAPEAEPRIPVECIYLGNHGHAGDTGNDWWLVSYSDGTTETLDNGTVMRDKALKTLCKK